MVTPDLGRLMVTFEATSKHGGLLGLMEAPDQFRGKCTL